jgi:hypothetical protein
MHFPLQVHLGRFLLVRTNDIGTMACWCRHKQVLPYGPTVRSKLRLDPTEFKLDDSIQYPCCDLLSCLLYRWQQGFRQETLAYIDQPKVGTGKVNCPVM